ncbi:uncharacterized protein LOC114529119 [Dendronephthya gigantea]|uniref:uncharacterized protein LOC114529119 n=1 Tax=Dendronephthya gigantea TaxID=151771 RepID=UPI0010692F81|nr:uncharacterized protein LOC114529119 [Dendronephthya gigantea]
MNEFILTFIKENADIQRDDEDSLKGTLGKPTLYWAVLDDTDFEAGGNLRLKGIGRTQIYIGKANNGIRGRWTKDSDNHCKMMKKCLDNVNAMTTYDPLRLEGIQLVDARLALAKVRRERSALFVIKTFGDDLEKAEMAVKKAEEAYYDATDSEEDERLDCEWEKATITLANLKKKLKSEERKKPEKKLEEAEKKHRKGKRDNASTNIIPHDVYDCTWEPKNMAYGMNFS